MRASPTIPDRMPLAIHRRTIDMECTGALGAHRKPARTTMPNVDEIIANFELLDETDDRYGYLIELGRALEPLPASAHDEANRVKGCASQVWLETQVRQAGDTDPILTFRGDSDAHIVRGLIYLALALYGGKHASEIVATDAGQLFERLGLGGHLTRQRSNGFSAMVARIRSDARASLSSV